MEKLLIQGGNTLQGAVRVSGAKNVALKTLIAACLTQEEITIHNVPLISDFYTMLEIIRELGGKIKLKEHTLHIQMKHIKKNTFSLDTAARIRTSFMFLAPLLLRNGEAIIPNPGGCRLGARPIDRLVDGLNQMGANIVYNSEDGYFHAKAKGLNGTLYRFEKNTHTGTETLIIAAVLAKGKTILENAAEEPEIDELITLLNQMGAKIQRTEARTIEIEGVEKLHGASYTIGPDRNEIITFAIVAIITKGDIIIEGAKKDTIEEFIEKLEEADGGVEVLENGIRFYYKGPLRAVDVTTAPYPGFMTDWQAPWAVLMTQAQGECIVHETVFENKLGYIEDLKKMGANVTLFNPKIDNPEKIYNFNLSDDKLQYFHAVRIVGPTKLHNAVVTMENIRAGAAVVIAAFAAKGTSTILGVEKLDRGYENFQKRLAKLGATIQRTKEE